MSADNKSTKRIILAALLLYSDSHIAHMYVLINIPHSTQNTQAFDAYNYFGRSQLVARSMDTVPPWI